VKKLNAKNSMDDLVTSVTNSSVFKYIKDTTIYGSFKVWHMILFMVIGPTLNWPSLILLLVIFAREAGNAVKEVTSNIITNGVYSSRSSGGDQGAAQGPASGQGAA
jgi:hypothetical protein